MAYNVDIRRRWLGAACLVIALAMLVAGQTVLRDRLSDIGLLVFWSSCFVFTFLAMIAAFLDMAALRRRARAEQKALFEDALQEIVRSKQAERTPPGKDAP